MGKKSAAEAVCRVAGINLLVVNSRVLFEVQSLETSLENIDLIRREALLQNSALYLQAFDVVFDGKEAMNFAEALN